MPSVSSPTAQLCPPSITGLVLAAGAGSRMGLPKALMKTVDGTPWLELAVAVLRAGGCDRVIVVLGARADQARANVPAGADVVVASDWSEGMSASLRAGMKAAGSGNPTAMLITLVDLPGMPATVAQRLAALASPGALAQAIYAGEPGHPVLIGYDHFAGVIASLSGDRGARPYLQAHGVSEVECGDLFDGHDIDSMLD
jgi:CTP:molybdopterin cytidylyltransferase MocA